MAERCPACGGSFDPGGLATATRSRSSPGAREYRAHALCRLRQRSHGCSPGARPGQRSVRGRDLRGRPCAGSIACWSPCGPWWSATSCGSSAACAPGSRVLEVGAGDGRFVSRLPAAGFEARGIEPSEGGGPDGARSRGSRGARHGGGAGPRAGEPRRAWWCGTCSSTCATRPGPWPRIADWLRPGGRVVVACPNLASLQARIGGDRWFHQDVPRHLTHFTAAGLVCCSSAPAFGSSGSAT